MRDKTVMTCPSTLPKLTRTGRRVFVKITNLLSYINQHNAEKIANEKQSVKGGGHA